MLDPGLNLEAFLLEDLKLFDKLLVLHHDLVVFLVQGLVVCTEALVIVLKVHQFLLYFVLFELVSNVLFDLRLT